MEYQLLNYSTLLDYTLLEFLVVWVSNSPESSVMGLGLVDSSAQSEVGDSSPLLFCLLAFFVFVVILYFC